MIPSRNRSVPAPRFTDATLGFLRDLARNNDRDWFRARKAEYEQHVRQPMVEFIERLALDLPRFAPDLVASPKVSLYRVYRDTRFSRDKRPLKSHIAAIFPHRTLTKHGGASLYFHVEPGRVFIGGGIYAPQPRDLYRLRQHVAGNLPRLLAIVDAPEFRRSFGAMRGESLRRVPAGFDRDHPAADYLKLKRYLAGCERPERFATGPRAYSSLLRLFEQIAPLIAFLNEPLAAAMESPPPPAPQPPR